MSRLMSLRLCSSLHDVATLLNFKTKALAYILYKMPESEKYKEFEIPKRSGGVRQIQAPCDQLKRAQKTLSTLLQDCIDEINAVNNRSDAGDLPDKIAHGFKRRRSIITNAVRHRARRFVFNVDIEDFFGSINFGRVRGFFIKDKNFALDPKVATVIAQIACRKGSLAHGGSLPQGSPCSPVISNLIGHVMDIHLAKLADSQGVTYTRYADDLTFSTNKRLFPVQIASPNEIGPHHWSAGTTLCHLIEQSGFKLNSKKTRMQYFDSRQQVTGLIVNRQINAPNEYRHLVRAMVYNLKTKGNFNFVTYKLNSEGKKEKTEVPGTLDRLRGKLEFVVSANRRGVVADATEPLNGLEHLYRSFLMYQDFYAVNRPLIVCEGKTDNVYLAHATRSLFASFPTLAGKDKAGKIVLNFRRHRYPGKRKGKMTARLLQLHGGTPHLKDFMVAYFDECKTFKAPSGSSPIVIVIDNDDGAKQIKSLAKSMFKVTVNDADDFFYLFANLYLVLTPIAPPATQSMIEDFFDKKSLSIPLDGKTFNPENDHDTKSQYGKARFAYEVVAKNADSIDFKGFKPLLSRINAAIGAHTAKMKAAAVAKP